MQYITNYLFCYINLLNQPIIYCIKIYYSMDSVSRKITKKRADIPPYVYSIKSVAELPRNFGK